MSTINLLPNDYVQRSARRRANILCVALFGVVMAAVLGAALVGDRSSRHTRHVRDQVDAAYAYAAQQIQQLQSLEARRQTMQDRAEAIGSLLERVPRSRLLGIIANALPENTSLTKVDLETKRLVLPIATPAPGAKAPTKFDAVAAARASKGPPVVVTMELIGLAATDVQVARFISNLARNSLIQSADLVFSQEKLIDKIPTREFQVHLELKNGADAINDVAVSAVANAAESDSGAYSKGVGQ
ncbi:MAG: PilN domain-containing protein [Phycisphaerae bacterium]